MPSKTNRPKCEWIYFFDSILVSYQRLFQIQLMHLNCSAYYKRIDDTHSLSFHRWLCTNIEITSDILLQTYFMFSFYYFVFQLSMSLLILNDFMLWICLLYFHITIDVLHLPCSFSLNLSSSLLHSSYTPYWFVIISNHSKNEKKFDRVIWRATHRADVQMEIRWGNSCDRMWCASHCACS